MTMTAAPHSIDPATYLDDLLTQASPDLMRQMLQGCINQILSAQADTVCGAEYGVASPSGSTTATGTATATLIPVSAPSMSQYRSCATVRSSRTGCSSAVREQNGRRRL